MAALSVRPVHHGPTFIVLNLGTMQLMRTNWFPASGSDIQLGSIMRSSFLAGAAVGALGGVLQDQTRITREAASQLWSRRPDADRDVLFEMNPVTGVRQEDLIGGTPEPTREGGLEQLDAIVAGLLATGANDPTIPTTYRAHAKAQASRDSPRFTSSLKPPAQLRGSARRTWSAQPPLDAAPK
jgi:hypothetical protein